MVRTYRLFFAKIFSGNFPGVGHMTHPYDALDPTECLSGKSAKTEKRSSSKCRISLKKEDIASKFIAVGIHSRWNRSDSYPSGEK